MSFLIGFLIFMLLHPSRASFLATAQMCFCSLKRKSPLKPAKFFIVRYEDGENFQTPVLGR